MSSEAPRRGTGRDALIASTGLALVAGLVASLAIGGRRDREIRLTDYENTIYSQAGEDGIIQKVFEVVEPTSHYAIEFGAGDGTRFSNVRNLIVHHGWGGLLIEGDAERAAALRENYAGYPRVRGVQAWVFPGNVELLFEENDVPRDVDMLVVDIDSNDYYVWRAIRSYRPKLVVMEYNSRFPPPIRMVIGFHPMMYWSERDYHHGASIQSFYELGKSKGYELIGSNTRGLNLFFVRESDFPRFGIRDNSPARLYHPFNFNVAIDPASLRERGMPPSEDLVLEESRIERRFRFDR